MKCKILFLFIGIIFMNQAIFCQSIVEVDKNQRLTINVKDFSERFILSGYSLTILNDFDTITLFIKEGKEFIFEINAVGCHTVIIEKEGYETGIIDWEQTDETNEVYVEFHLPKLELSKKDIRNGKRNSTIWEGKICTWCGGFEKVNPGLVTARVQVHSKGSSYTSSIPLWSYYYPELYN